MARNRNSRSGARASRRRSVSLLVLSSARLRLEALVRLLRGIAGFRAEGLWVPVEAAPPRVAERRPDILLLDLPLDEALRAATRVAREARGVRVVVLCTRDHERHAMALARSGVTGFLPADASLADVRATVGSVLRGEVRFPPRIAALSIRPPAGGAGGDLDGTDVADLTEREREILRLVDRGLMNREIAAALGIGVATVKNHVHNILEKLHVPRRGAATSALRRSGWLPPAPEGDAPTGRDGVG